MRNEEKFLHSILLGSRNGDIKWELAPPLPEIKLSSVYQAKIGLNKEFTLYIAKTNVPSDPYFFAVELHGSICFSILTSEMESRYAIQALYDVASSTSDAVLKFKQYLEAELNKLNPPHS